jgi:hypothetical protein
MSAFMLQPEPAKLLAICSCHHTVEVKPWKSLEQGSKRKPEANWQPTLYGVHIIHQRVAASKSEI